MGRGYSGKRWVYLESQMQPVCSLIENKDKTMGCKWDIFIKHEGHKIDAWDLPRFRVKKGGTYIAKDCGHLKNMRLYAQRGPKSNLTQVNKPMVRVIKKWFKWKLCSVFSPMVIQCWNMKPCMSCLLGYVSQTIQPCISLILQVRYLSRIYACPSLKCNYQSLQSAQFIALSCGEVTTIDNRSWICVHAYVDDC